METTDNIQFLSHFITDTIYLIKEKDAVTNVYEQKKEEPKAIVNEPVAAGKKVQAAFNKILEAPMKELLAKIMTSIQITAPDYEEILYSESLLDSIPYGCKLLLLFGNTSANNETYQLQKKGNTTVIYADSLEEINKSVELKKKLWAVLKQVELS